MAATAVTTSMAGAINYTYVTDTSADWASVPNNTYFYDKADKLVHYKNSGGTVLEIFGAGGLTNFTEAQATTSPNNTVYVDSLTAVGSTTDVDVAIVPKGTGAFMLAVPDGTATGGNKRGTNAVDLQTNRGVATGARVASGNGSFAAGVANTASGSNSFAIGNLNSATNQSAGCIGDTNSATQQYAYSFGASNIASGTLGFCLGYGNTSSAWPSFTLGSSNVSSATGAVSIGDTNTADGSYSLALGRQSRAFGIYGRQTYASGQEGLAGDSQTSKFILRERTTGNTATTLTSDSGAAAATNQVILSNQSAYRFKGTIVGKQSGSTNAAVWDIDGFIVRGANAAATTLNVSNVTLVQNTPAWGTPTLAADTTNGGLQVQVTGAAATNIQWTAVIETTEVIYA
jgi:hypothetical protein